MALANLNSYSRTGTTHRLTGKCTFGEDFRLLLVGLKRLAVAGHRGSEVAIAKFLFTHWEGL